ncbi:MAG: hypothetical protein IGS48_00090 [Oscillatoriales cyanobacterium C42_A2020_001]|nr:hypothetical protein [Leptolyngbyaceae cyanobacterium C42_A2020_001]
MNRSFKLPLTTRQYAQATQVTTVAELPEALGSVGLATNRPTLVLIGGASGISQDYMLRLRDLFVEVLAPLVETAGACVVDGGTDAGIMRLMGQARAQMKATFPLVGVTAIGTVILPNVRPVSADAARLEPHHTHFVLVPGKEWGDESPWIAQVANELARSAGSVTLLINGGKIAWIDVTNSVKAKRPVIIIAGSGRTADTLAAMLRGKTMDDSTPKFTQTGLLKAVDLEEGFDAIAHLITTHLTPCSIKQET